MNTSDASGKLQPVIAYLSPALPAISETFVYEELLALERKGYGVVPFSVHQPKMPVAGQEPLSARVTHLYAPSAALVVLSGLLRSAGFGLRLFPALRLLLSDMAEVGVFKVSAWKLGFQFLAGAKLARQLLDKQCRHLHVHFADTPGQIAMYASSLSGVPFTVMAHANDIYEAGMLLQRKAARASRFLTISDFNRRYLEQLGIEAGQLGVVRCGVSFVAAPKAPRNAEGAAAIRVGSLGRMVEKKGFDVLIRAVAALRQAGQLVELHIAGDGPLMADLCSLVDELSLQQAVFFVGGLPHNQVSGWMRSLDMFVLACKRSADGDMDGIPVVLMEAMSQSVPVVSTQISGIPELVVHRQTGLLAQPDDAEDLAQKMLELIHSPELNERLTQAASRHVATEFSQSVNIDRLAQHIQFAMEHSKS